MDGSQLEFRQKDFSSLSQTVEEEQRVFPTRQRHEYPVVVFDEPVFPKRLVETAVKLPLKGLAGFH